MTAPTGPRGPALLVALVCLLLLAHVPRSARTNYVGAADATEYLRQTRSLVEDGDAWIRPAEVELRHTWRLMPVPVEPALVSDQRRFSRFPVGAPLLFMPGYTLGGRLGVVWSVALFGCAALAYLFGWLARVTGDRWAAALAVTALGTSGPFVAMSMAEMTEVPALALIAAALWARARDEAQPGGFGVAVPALAAAFLPWLHLRYAPAALLLAWWGWRDLRRQRGRLLVAAGVVAAGWLGLWAWAWSLTGDPSPLSVTRISGTNSLESFAGLPGLVKGMLGHLVDQRVGLLVHAPLLALGLAGVWTLEGRARSQARDLALAALPVYLAFSAHQNWGSGWSPPCRFWIALTPVLVLGLAGLVRAARRHPEVWPWLVPPGLLGLAWTASYWWAPALQLPSDQSNLAPPLAILWREGGPDLTWCLPQWILSSSARELVLGALALAVGLAWAAALVGAARGQPAAGRGRVAAAALLAFGAWAWGTRPAGPPHDPLRVWPRFDVRFLHSYPSRMAKFAKLCQQQRRFDLEAEVLRQVVELEPTFLISWIRLSDLVARTRPDEADRLRQQALRIADLRLSGRRETYSDQALLAKKLGREAFAREKLEAFVEDFGVRVDYARRQLDEDAGPSAPPSPFRAPGGPPLVTLGASAPGARDPDQPDAIHLQGRRAVPGEGEREALAPGPGVQGP